MTSTTEAKKANKQNRLRQQVRNQTLLSAIAYHVPILGSYLAVAFDLARFDYADIFDFQLMVLGMIGVCLLVNSVIPKPGNRYGFFMLVTQGIVWLVLYSLWMLILQDLRFFGLAAAVVAFTFLFSYGRLVYSLLMLLFFLVFHFSLCTYAIVILKQPGDLAMELLSTVFFGMVNVFLAFLGHQLVAQKRGLVAAKRQIQAGEIELRAAMKALRKIANSDEMTGLMNRRAMQDAMRREMERCRREKTTFSLAMLDVDHFKQVNDRYGHACGDHCLIELAGRIRESIRSIDLAARWGGEEFLVLFIDTHLETGLRATENLKQTVESDAINFEGRLLHIHSSIGVVEVGPHDDLGMKIREADSLLYQAKILGRNRIESEISQSGLNPKMTPHPG